MIDSDTDPVSYHPATHITVGTPDLPQVADLDADTFPELLVANGPGNENKLYINPGSGDFSAVIPIGLGSDSQNDDSRAVVVDTFGSHLAVVVANAGQVKNTSLPISSR